MSKYLPDTINMDKVCEKYGNEKNYNILQITYKNFLEIFISSLIDFKAIDKIIKDSNLVFKKIGDESYNIYHRESKLNSDYLFIRNNIHIENLSDEQIEALIDNNIYETFITDTINDVLKEDKDFLSYDSDPNNMVFTKGIIFEFAYDGSELNDTERQEREIVIKQIFDIISKSLEDSPFVTNFIIYDKKVDYFKPLIKDRNSLLSRLKIVKNINYAENENTKKEVAKDEIDKAIKTIAPEIKKENTRESLVSKLNQIKNKREDVLKEEDKILEDSLSDSIVKESTKKEMEDTFKESNDLLDSIVNKKEEISKEEKPIKKIVIKDPTIEEDTTNKEEIIEEPIIENTSIEIKNNNKEYVGTIGNKKYIIRYVSSFKNNDKELNIYDYSINGYHNAYYSEIELDKVDASIIETVFGLDNLKEARKNNTSYLGYVKDNYLIKDKDIDNIYLFNKLVRRENSNIVIIEDINKHKDSSKNNYYILNLSNNNSYIVNTETDIFSNINSNEELAKWLTDEVINNSKDKSGYIGKLGLNGVIIKGA